MSKSISGIFSALLLALISACAQGRGGGDSGSTETSDPPASAAESQAGAAVELVCPPSLEWGQPLPLEVTDGAEIAEPEVAMFCTYGIETGPDAAASAPSWSLSGDPVQLSPADTALLRDELGELEPVTDAASRICTMDLGPVHMFVIAAQDVRQAITVDGYGCRDVRLISPLGNVDEPLNSDDNPVTANFEGSAQLDSFISTLSEDS